MHEWLLTVNKVFAQVVKASQTGSHENIAICIIDSLSFLLDYESLVQKLFPPFAQTDNKPLLTSQMIRTAKTSLQIAMVSCSVFKMSFYFMILFF